MKTWEDVYKLPLRKDIHSDWVYDANDNFVFQFEYEETNAASYRKILGEQILTLDVINGKIHEKVDATFRYDNGTILMFGIPFITMRGWGNLTGSGAMRLSSDEAANIQDTFAEFIIKQLS